MASQREILNHLNEIIKVKVNTIRGTSYVQYVMRSLPGSSRYEVYICDVHLLTIKDTGESNWILDNLIKMDKAKELDNVVNLEELELSLKAVLHHWL